jgi:hypothetical protein
VSPMAAAMKLGGDLADLAVSCCAARHVVALATRPPEYVARAGPVRKERRNGPNQGLHASPQLNITRLHVLSNNHRCLPFS